MRKNKIQFQYQAIACLNFSKPMEIMSNVSRPYLIGNGQMDLFVQTVGHRLIVI